MATIIEMPKLSDTMSEGKILTWLKREGDEVQAGEVLAEIESDKANMEMPAYEAGFLRKVLVGEGGSAPVGAAIAIVTEDASEDIGEILGSLGSSGGTAAPPKKAAGAPQGKDRPESGKKESGKKAPEEPGRAAKAERREPATGSPRAEPREAARTAVAEAPPATPRSRPHERGDGRGKVLASPLAFRMASELGLDIRSLRGTGPEGRVVKRDIEQALAGSGRPTDPAPSRPTDPAPGRAGAATAPAGVRPFTPPPPVEAEGEDGYEDTPVSTMRRIIADRLVESTTTAPHYFVTVEVDMGHAVEAREELNQLEGVSITLNDLIVKAVATALVRHPMLNASWRGTSIRRFKSADIGVAVALEEGLITPVVRGCQSKSLGRIALETKDLIARAREKKLRPEEFKGGTFTISNLGMLGVKHFTAIINPPEACILAVGAIEEVPVVKDGAIVPGRRMSMTLSSDHRVVDGAEAAKFLREVKSLLERPMSLAL